MQYTNFYRQLSVPFCILLELETLKLNWIKLKELIESYTDKYQDQIACSYRYKLGYGYGYG